MFQKFIFASVFSLLTAPFCWADPSGAPSAAPGAASPTPLSPEAMGKQLEQLLQQLAAPGQEAAKKVYGIDIEKEMGGAAGALPQGAGTAASASTTPNAEAIFQDVFQKTTGLAGASMKILGKMAEEDLKEMGQGGAESLAPPRNENTRKAEDLVGQGTLKSLLGDVKGAIPLFQQAITLNPEFGTAYYNLACAYAKLGDVDRFAAPLQKAIALDGKYLDMANRDSDFDQVRKTSAFLAIGKR